MEKVTRTVAPFAGAWVETCASRTGTGCYTVAPFAGAWVETGNVRAMIHMTWRRSLRGSVGRNLYDGEYFYPWVVAPFAGAWVETRPIARRSWTRRVAPFAGAWVE